MYHHILRLRIHLLLLLGLPVALAFIAFAPIGRADAVGAEASASIVASAGETVCAGVTAAPIAECRALVALFDGTDGAHWHNHTNWLTMSSAASPCDWFGVVCENGQVARLLLAANHLNGGLPASLADLTQLRELDLTNNLLSGPLPVRLCLLARRGVTGDLSYNRMNPFTPEIAACLTHIDPDWQLTQTAPPTNLHVSAILTSAIQLTWTPISYTSGSGHYEIGVAASRLGPFTVHGVTADKHASSYRVDGLLPGRTYVVRVRTFSAASAEQANDLMSGAAATAAVTADPRRTLAAVYFAADNDLSPYVPDILRRLRRGSAVNPNVDVLYLSDEAGDGNTNVWFISRGVITPTSAVTDAWGVNELDTADPATLAWFLNYARATYPLSRTLVSLIGHGVGLTPEIAWPVATEQVIGARVGEGSEAIPLPREKDATATDLTNGSYLSTVDVGVALAAATDNGARPFDVIFFDQCFGGSLDALYEVRTAARVFVASPNYAWLAAPYDDYLPLFAPAASNEQWAEAIINIYQANLNDEHPNAIFWVTAQQIANLAQASNTLATALLFATQTGAIEPIRLAALQSHYVDTAQCGEQAFHLAPPDEQIGIGHFAGRLRETFAPGDIFGVSAAASEIITQVLGIHQTHRVGAPYIAPDEFWEYDDALTVLTPLRRDVGAGTAWRASVYRSDAPFQAVWSPDPSIVVTVTTSLASARDGVWDDFLAAWYTKNMIPTVGQWCRYTPPAVVISDTSGTITLTVSSPNAASALLQWSAAPGADRYRVFIQRVDSLAWVLAAVIPGDGLLHLQEKLPVGTQRFRVVALDEENAVIAQSNEATVEIERKVYLPAIRNEKIEVRK